MISKMVQGWLMKFWRCLYPKVLNLSAVAATAETEALNSKNLNTSTAAGKRESTSHYVVLGLSCCLFPLGFFNPVRLAK